MTTVHAAVPSENWDDDFEFQQRTSTSQNPIFDNRVSIASSDWDQDDSSRAPTNTILEDKTNTFVPLADWAEPGPSTPKKFLQKPATENWDDDFEDSPLRKPFPSPPGSATRSRRAPIPQTPQTENWDDDFESPPRNTNPRSLESRLMSAESYSSSEDEGDDHNGNDAHDTDDPERDEEDKTVTARSRRAALARLTNKTPPPVPVVPLQIDTHNSYQPHPFPRSPTSSVFSVPRPPSAFTVNSTTHLRPTVSRTSSNGPSSFSPSPPAHRETRERRRLRKKSRPPGVDPIELDTFSPIIPEKDGYETSDGNIETQNDVRPQTPPPQPASVPATPGSGGATLLSRIGSVKKWGARRKRASTTPSDTVQEHNTQATTEPDQDQTPRRHSQASSASTPSVESSSAVDESRQQSSVKGKRSSTGAPSTSSNWFFRSGSSNHSNETGLSSRSSNTDLKQNRKVSGSSRPPEPSPTKLVKRKSLGFVPLRMGFGGNSAVVDDGREKDPKRRVSAHRPISPSPQMGNGSLRRTSESSDSIREGDEGTGSLRDKDGSRGFMGSVRRLSLTHRHQRTKSGVSLASVTEVEAVFGSPPRDNAITPKPSRQLPPSDGILPPVPLLPPIELSPPSPPRHRPKAASGSGQLRLPVSPSESLLATAASAGTLSAIPSANSSAQASPITPAIRSMKKAGSPQAASLGRSTIGPSDARAQAIATRRSSLGDLKIPDRISQAQVSLRRDLGMVREFAANVEQLKELQTTYNDLVNQVEQILDRYAHAHAQQPPEEPRAVSPSFLANLTRPKLRKRSNTGTSPPPRDDSQSSERSNSPTASTPALNSQEAYKQLAAAFYTINSKYRISWECAELLIELGGGNAATAPSSSVSAPAIGPDSRKSSGNRERAVTLSGEESKPPTPIPGASASEPSTLKANSPNVTSPQNANWKASTGKHDLTQRQLSLLRDMLNNAEAFSTPAHIPEETSPPTAMSNVHRDWRWGDAMSSTITLPSEDSSLGESANKKKKRRARLGLTGLRDMLRMLKKKESENSMATAASSIPTSASSLSVNTSQHDAHLYPPYGSTQGRRRAKTATANDEERVGRSTSPVLRPPSLKTKRSPRRPSLAAIFRIGQKQKPPPLPTEHTNSSKPNLAEDAISPRSNSRSTNRSSTGDEDWDQIDSSSDLDNNVKSLGDGTATVRVKNRHRSPYLQDYNPPPGQRGLVTKRSASGSQSSIWGERGESSAISPTNPRGTRLSNVNEDVDSSPLPKNCHPRPISARLASYGSKPPKTGSVRSMPPQPLLPDPKLAMTPENIKPLLENTKEVHVRLNECINEIRTLLQSCKDN